MQSDSFLAVPSGSLKHIVMCCVKEQSEENSLIYQVLIHLKSDSVPRSNTPLKINCIYQQSRTICINRSIMAIQLVCEI